MNTAYAARSGKDHRDENFPVASRLLAKRHRPAILAFYNFARAADDVAIIRHFGPTRSLPSWTVSRRRLPDAAMPTERPWPCEQFWQSAVSRRGMLLIS